MNRRCNPEMADTCCPRDTRLQASWICLAPRWSCQGQGTSVQSGRCSLFRSQWHTCFPLGQWTHFRQTFTWPSPPLSLRNHSTLGLHHRSEGMLVQSFLYAYPCHTLPRGPSCSCAHSSFPSKLLLTVSQTFRFTRTNLTYHPTFPSKTFCVLPRQKVQAWQ